MSHFCLVQAICCSRPASEIKKQVPDTAGRLSTPVAAATSVPDKRAGRVTSYPTLSPVTTPRMKTYPWGPRAGERMGHGSFGGEPAPLHPGTQLAAASQGPQDDSGFLGGGQGGGWPDHALSGCEHSQIPLITMRQ